LYIVTPLVYIIHVYVADDVGLFLATVEECAPAAVIQLMLDTNETS